MKDEYKELLCRVRFIDGVPAKTYLSDVEIVRCKDCEFYNPEKMCVAFSWIRGSKIKIRKDEEDFCSWATKKKE